MHVQSLLPPIRARLDEGDWKGRIEDTTPCDNILWNASARRVNAAVGWRQGEQLASVRLTMDIGQRRNMSSGDGTPASSAVLNIHRERPCNSCNRRRGCGYRETILLFVLLMYRLFRSLLLCFSSACGLSLLPLLFV